MCVCVREREIVNNCMSIRERERKREREREAEVESKREIHEGVYEWMGERERRRERKSEEGTEGKRRRQKKTCLEDPRQIS